MPPKSSSHASAVPRSARAGSSSSSPPNPSQKAKNAGREQILPIDELSEWVEGLLPNAVVVRKPNGAMYQAGTKIFAFTRPNGIAMKLPEQRVAGLVDAREDASFLVMGARTMRGWLMLRYASPSDYRQDGKLFEEAMNFVASLKK